MDIFGILTMVGGLALFLFGMNAMGQALKSYREAAFSEFSKK